ncbi:conserved hypothetical protein [Ricinus communis]|uniref:Uncharacterized protein n=1 Tax=Ricinus communis TaxID=3988 RepID=B9SZF9_RICCO|nr:conserved hypothetical protein [Ricinus communis]
MDIRIPGMIIDVIMKCLSSSSMQITWNGGLTSSFIPSRGVRQGDSLSPYLFMLCMKRLSHAINLEVALSFPNFSSRITWCYSLKLQLSRLSLLNWSSRNFVTAGVSKLAKQNLRCIFPEM